ncbi:phosphoryl transfer system HPr [Fictibacillus macauensis ZFHKF-1]|uniref:Phosphoryl transfer system HPr n=1 Tax=Fictibacillus macauensis ZFHKF-1 TaxID=1196324 RepID=I8UK81_9BACL|nr:HPr family phosphocarrier protein [Fictibacillus macauensis]EIT87290.1 phosphoryl transfer system HPr [Fictibacillus macauensis ZFHKF-1]
MKMIATKPLYRRNAALFVEQATALNQPLLLKKGHLTANGQSLLGVITLTILPGDTIDFISAASLSSLIQYVEECALFRKA